MYGRCEREQESSWGEEEEDAEVLAQWNQTPKTLMRTNRGY